MPSIALPMHARHLLERTGATSVCFWRAGSDGVAHPLECLPAGWIERPFVLNPPDQDIALYADSAEVAAHLPFALRARTRVALPAALAVARHRFKNGDSVGVHLAWSAAQPASTSFAADTETQRFLLQPFALLDSAGLRSASPVSAWEIADSLSQAVVLLVPEVFCGYLNGAAGALLGMPAGFASLSELARGLRGLVSRAQNEAALREQLKPAFAGRMPETASSMTWRFADAPRALRVTFSPLQAAVQRGWLWIFEDVSTEVELHDRIQREERKFHTFYENLTDAIVQYGLEGTARECNDSYARLFGKEVGAAVFHRRPIGAEGSGKQTIEWDEIVSECVAHDAFGPYESECMLADGRRMLLESSAVLHREAGAGGAIWEVHRDVTQRKRAEAELILAAEAFAHHSDGVLLTDAAGLILTANQAMCRMSGYAPGSLQDRSVEILHSDAHDGQSFSKLQGRLLRQGGWQGGVWSRGFDGERFFKWVSVTAVHNAGGDVTHYVHVYRDIEVVRGAQNRIEYLATHDELTRLPNRVLFEDRLAATMRKSESSGTIIGVLRIDVTEMKHLNTVMGHDAGDRLVRRIARRLERVTPQTFLVARLGGDQFAVMAPVGAPSELTNYCEHVLQQLARPHRLNGVEVVVPAVIGACICPGDGSIANELLIKADAALHRAKQSGHSEVQFFTPEILEQMRARFTIENGLRRAIEHSELHLVFQPQFDARDGLVQSCEALLRWAPQGEPCPPATFIPIAEQAGLIVPLTEWVLRSVCAEIRETDAAGCAIGSFSVNISAMHFQQANMLEALLRILDEERVSPARFCLEVTESALVNAERGERALCAAKEAGFGISIDDFGTGFSSLAYLKRFRIDELKIDRSFVQGIETDARDRAIVGASIAMGHSLGMRVVAEGVESEAQRDFLCRQGCDLLQGYGLSRPLGSDALRAFLHRGQLERAAV